MTNFNRPRRVTYLDGNIPETGYGLLPALIVRRIVTGVLTQYLYDSLRRQYGMFRNGIAMTKHHGMRGQGFSSSDGMALHFVLFPNDIQGA